MTSLYPAEPPAAPDVEARLSMLHWHLMRADQMRAGVSARAGTVLSTNALVVAGVALALSLRSEKPNAVLLVAALAALGCVAVSVGNATLALVTIRGWGRVFGDSTTPEAFPYCYTELDRVSGTFADFRRRLTTASREESHDSALAELWRCSRLHGHRYRRLRVATCWLLAALALFLLVAAASALR